MDRNANWLYISGEELRAGLSPILRAQEINAANNARLADENAELADDNAALLVRFEALHKDLAETKQAQADSMDRAELADSLVSELKVELHESQEALSKVTENHKRHSQELLDTIEQHDKAVKAAQQEVADLKGKVTHKDKEIAQLSKDVQTYDKQVQKALNYLKDRVEDHKDIKSFISTPRNAQGSHPNGIDPKLGAVSEIGILHQATFQYLVATKNPDRIHHRRTSQSPVQGVPSPNPPAVSEEQERRRSADPPKTIMKASLQSTRVEEKDREKSAATQPSTRMPSRLFSARRKNHDEEKADQEIERPEEYIRPKGYFGRRAYNRPNISDGTGIGQEPQKRKQADRTEMESPLTPCLTRERQASKGNELEPPSPPRKRSRKNINTPNESYVNESESTAEHEAGRKGPRTNAQSQDGSQGSLRLNRYRSSSDQDEDTRNPVTHSHKPADGPYQPRRFTMGQ